MLGAREPAAPRRRRDRALLVVVLAGAAALAAASTAAADVYKRSIVPADQALATSMVLRKADLGTASAKGGPTKPQNEPLQCAYYRPKASDLVITGEAESTWNIGVGEIVSDVTVLRTPQMVATDWKRSFGNTGAFLRCLREQTVKELGKGMKLLSLRRLPFPAVGETRTRFAWCSTQRHPARPSGWSPTR